MHRGYLALWRKLSDHPFWKEKREFSKAEAWIDILWEVQHCEKPKQVVLGMTHLVCHYGESLKSLETWSKRWGWNKSRVRRFLQLLENMSQIRHSSEQKTTRITVLNYMQYDPKRNANETQMKRQRNDSETTATPDKNVNNAKNVKEEDIVGQKPRQQIPYKEIIDFFNEVTGKSFKHTTNGTKSHIRARWSEGFRIDDFKEVIKEKNYEWANNPDMEQYIRPTTLFGTKFESYLQAAKESNTVKIKSTWVPNVNFSTNVSN